MKFSIVIPVYNAEKTIADLLNSLVEQTLSSYEIIVVDDGSKDKTPSIIKDFQKEHQRKVKIISQQNKGPATARNKGIAKAKGKYVAFTDADCVVPEDWLEQIEKIFVKYPEVAGVGGVLEPSKNNWIANIERQKNKRLYGMKDKLIIAGRNCPIGGTNNICFKKDVLDEVEGFDENFSKAAGEDFDLKLRICDKGHKLAFAPIKVTHNETYDFNYLLRHAGKRGIPFKTSNRHLFWKVILLLPVIIPILLYKIIVYRFKSNKK